MRERTWEILNVGNIEAATDCLLGGSTAKPASAHRFRLCVGSNARPASPNGIEYGFELRDVMMIGRGHDDRHRDATSVDQQHPLAPLFSPDPSGLARRILGPVALS
jgi:hypothetical protein